MSIIIGIDLGTTNSVAAYVKDGKPIVIPNDINEYLTPSVVAFEKNKSDVIVGKKALNQAVVNPDRTIHSIKRLMGTDKRIKIGNDYFTPEEISSLILLKIKKDAENFLKQEITKAVITVPAYFNDNQRQATINASKIIGLEPVRIINEPTAASLAYGLNKNIDEKVVVFDIGGGTYDISILEIGDDVFQVLATNGDNYLGGDDFDKEIVDFIIEKFMLDEKIDLRKDNMIVQRIREEAVRVKTLLSSQEKVEISLPFITANNEGPKHFSYELTRSEFNKMLDKYVDRIINPIEKALKDAKLSADDIDRVILVGGSTRIPKIQELVMNYFKSAKLEKGVNPDECVAIGAAIQADLLNEKGKSTDLVLVDVTPFSLGVEVENSKMSKIIERNTPIPVSMKKLFTTISDNQRSVEIKVLQGEAERSDDNILLGIFELTDIEPAKAGEPKIEVEFDIDVNGVVTVTAKDLKTDKKKEIVIKNSKNLSKEELERLQKKSQKFIKQDEKQKEKDDLLNKLVGYKYDIKEIVNNNKDNTKIKDLVFDFENLLIDAENRLNENDLISAKEILEAMEFMLNEIKSLC